MSALVTTTPQTDEQGMLEGERLNALSIGGEVGKDSDPKTKKKVNFYNINPYLDRQIAYDVTESIIKLQVKPLLELHRVETYKI